MTASTTRHLPNRRLSDSDVRQAVTEWLNDSGYVLVERYYPHSGGSGTAFLVRSHGALLELGRASKPSCVFFVSRLSDPIQGLVNRHFCAQVRDILLPKGDFFVGAISEYPAEFEPDYPDNAEELEESLVELTSQSAIASSEPPYISEYWRNPPITNVLCARP